MSNKIEASPLEIPQQTTSSNISYGDIAGQDHSILNTTLPYLNFYQDEQQSKPRTYVIKVSSNEPKTFPRTHSVDPLLLQNGR